MDLGREKRASFPKLLPSVFAYPFGGDGRAHLIGAAVFFGGVRFMLSLLSDKPRQYVTYGFCALAVYVALYLMSVIRTTADGRDELPDWPDPSEIYTNIRVDVFALAAVWVIGDVAFEWGFVALGFALYALSLLVFPMILLLVSAHGTIEAAHPLLVLQSIARTWRDYTLVIGFSLAILGIETLARASLTFIPFIGPPVATIVIFYLSVVEARALGLLYWCNEDDLAPTVG